MPIGACRGGRRSAVLMHALPARTLVHFIRHVYVRPVSAAAAQRCLSAVAPFPLFRLFDSFVGIVMTDDDAPSSPHCSPSCSIHCVQKASFQLPAGKPIDSQAWLLSGMAVAPSALILVAREKYSSACKRLATCGKGFCRPLRLNSAQAAPRHAGHWCRRTPTAQWHRPVATRRRSTCKGSSRPRAWPQILR